MKFIIDREKLLNSLNIVSKAVTSKGALHILSCILITAFEEGVKLTASNLEMGIETATIEAQVEDKGARAFEGKRFFDIIKKISGEKVAISVDGKGKAHITCGPSKYTLATVEADEFPSLPIVEKDKYIPLQQGCLKKSIKQTNFSVSVDESKPALSGELLDIKGNKLNLVSCDGYRISCKQLNNESGQKEGKLIIPGKTLADIYKLLSADDSEDVLIYATNNHILFEMSECRVVSRLIDGRFIDYESSLVGLSGTIAIISRDALYLGIDRAALVAEEQRKTPMKFHFQEDKVSIIVATEIGTCREDVAIKEIEGNDELKISFNHRYWMDVLAVIEDEFIKINFGTDVQPAIIMPVDETDTYRYLVLPLRVKN